MKTKKKELSCNDIINLSLKEQLSKRNEIIKQKDTEIKQLKKDIKLWKVISEGIDFDDLKKICDLERQNISLKQQLADVKKENKMYEALSKDLGITFKLYEKNMCKDCKKKILKLIKEAQK